MTALPVYLDPIIVNVSGQPLKGSPVGTVTAHMRIALESADASLHWKDVRRVFYATEFDGKTLRTYAMSAHMSLRDGRYARLYGEFASASELRSAQIRFWARNDWDAFIEEMRKWLEPADSDDGRLRTHVESCGTVLEFD